MGNWHADAVRYAWFDLTPMLAHWQNQESLRDRLQATTLHFDDQTSARAAWRHYASHLAWWAVEVSCAPCGPRKALARKTNANDEGCAAQDPTAGPRWALRRHASSQVR